ncbi:MAG: hypothetical protein A3A43_02490 [Candidatus Liptonbacteria bacterium RIFCSPLOWO2_01_FULL_56_20]|uniref:dTDP-4-dehydrorhamnose 3,5-epimerase n=1 Tax=Candidatus Liptonbacteria bacterium RIFCSPLOWO2_01_FULL_56_20 TaxID=1798652 RepID=A0A1G2CJD0_9BACT|nr:MAG: dTDP-4-dehydrorhamnose 3,5-epimerase [Parcubacteria group bacterium GW2011_GWB1_56_8]OGY98263.1 MAG: hypothetical protein A2681_00345 [Candidatus Liptonbacteria bacterium RIFCSPHIGHO2_01_FULL_56_18b]OGZ00840.1 MAG: hypothetical protein A3A43_02490 [Candidatus Liptonbacteria bacterium RIFCSPLOWO2_01_FULL_56_20]
MIVQETKLAGVLLIKPEPAGGGKGEIFEDARGLFLETYHESKYKDQGIGIHFVEDDISVSRKDVLRGIHGNNETWKLVSCTSGKIFFVAVNCDEASPEFGKWESFDLDDVNHWQVLVPPRHGSAYLALSDTVVFQYKQSTHYAPKSQFSFRWDDPRFNIRWPVDKPILSARDAT